jgi:hypothetical protein
LIARNLRSPLALYSLGNALNVAALVLFLPAVAAISRDTAKAASLGLLVGQLGAVLGAFAFQITAPRFLAIEAADRHPALLRGILTYQVALGFVVGVIALGVGAGGMMASIAALSATVIGYASVLVWQWFHITRASGSSQARWLVLSRASLVLMFAYSAFGPGFDARAGAMFVVVAALIFLVPTYHTWRCEKVLSSGPAARGSAAALLRQEIAGGSRFFVASLASSVYMLGPATLVALLAPERLLAIQMFDRLRLAASGFAGMVLSGVYSLLLRQDQSRRSDLYRRVTRPLAWAAVPVAIALLALGVSLPPAYLAPAGPWLLSLREVLLASACVVASLASNAIAMTMVLPAKGDRRFLVATFAGAFAFVAGVGAMLAFGSAPDVAVLVSAFAAEIIVLLAMLRAGQRSLLISR